jgi:two-component system response regulator MprA
LYASPLEGGHGPLGDDRQERSQQTATRVPTRPILVVDDDQAILMTITEILALEGYPFITAADGAEALRQIAAQQPALVLLDMRMPILNGWEVARMLRERGIMVPIVVMTAAQDARLWSEQIDAAGYLAKPFDLDDLLDTIARFVSD